tara:strand:+ start:25302 stop:26789 length:1488 start_codon:yes stop_codon:yes gene_type:complete
MQPDTMDYRKQELGKLTAIYNNDMLSRRRGEWDLISLVSEYKDRVIGYVAYGIVQCLDRFQENLFLGGGMSLALYHYDDEKFVEYYNDEKFDYDLFITANTHLEAASIARKVSDIIEKFANDSGIYIVKRRRGKNVVNIFLVKRVDENDPNYEYSKETIKIQIILRLYTHRSQIIGMFDLGPCQIMYSKGHGFETTRMGKHCLENNVQYIDPSRNNANFCQRLEKYRERGFEIKAPNQIGDFLLENVNHIKVSNLKDHSIFVNQKDPFNPRNEFMGNYIRIESRWNNKGSMFGGRSDYDENIEFHTDRLKYEMYKGVFHGHLFLPVNGIFDQCSIPVGPNLESSKEDCIQKYIYGHNLPRLIREGRYKDSSIAKLIPDKSIRINIIQTLLIDGNPELAKDMFSVELHKKCELIASQVPSLDSEASWKIANPGEQGGGSFVKRPMSGRDFWNIEYFKPIQVGVPVEAILCFGVLAKRYGFGKDVIKLLCATYLETF